MISALSILHNFAAQWHHCTSPSTD